MVVMDDTSALNFLGSVA